MPNPVRTQDPPREALRTFFFWLRTALEGIFRGPVVAILSPRWGPPGRQGHDAHAVRGAKKRESRTNGTQLMLVPCSGGLADTLARDGLCSREPTTATQCALHRPCGWLSARSPPVSGKLPLRLWEAGGAERQGIAADTVTARFRRWPNRIVTQRG